MYSDMMRRASSYPESFTLWIHSVLSMEKKFSAKALSYGLPRLDMDGVMPYDCIRLNNPRNIITATSTVTNMTSGATIIRSMKKLPIL